MRRTVLVLASIALISAVLLFKSPRNFPSKTLISVSDGETVNSVAQDLAVKKIISSEISFKLLMKVFDGKHGVKAGDYYFSSPANIFLVAHRFASGDFGLQPIKVTIPEGTNVVEISNIIKSLVPNFGTIQFVILAKDKEGFLFPDTYYFLPNVKPQDVIDMMANNFDSKIKTIQDKITAFGKPLNDIIKVASYVEEEARITDTRMIIAGIIWKRLDIGMPIQIDSTFQYVNGKNTYALTYDDLQIDSPYNTYKYKGLTPTPITNPGLEAITATITPTQTKYLYFLSDKNGEMHYAVTLSEHNANKAKYLQ